MKRDLRGRRDLKEIRGYLGTMAKKARKGYLESLNHFDKDNLLSSLTFRNQFIYNIQV